MRIWLVLSFSGLLAISTNTAQAQEWCGFLDKEHSRVRCGYSTLAQCKQALGENKDAICMPSPSFAGTRRSIQNG